MPREFKPRDWSVGDLVKIADHGKMVRDETQRNWRARLAAMLTPQSGCTHTTGTMVEVENDHGVWGVIVCNGCGAQTARECPHEKCTWHADDTVLVCDNCGYDGT